jgi:hypothetical protein
MLVKMKERLDCLLFFKTWVLFAVIAISTVVSSPTLKAQSLSFEVVTNPDVDFVFNTVQKYQSGLLAMNAITLRITAVGVNWDLYVGAETDVAGTWDIVSTYGVNGNDPNVELLKVRFRNTASTSQEATFFDLQDISTPVYIIGSELADPVINCPATGTNTPGSYLTDPQCYQFNVDLQITPGFTLKPGLYKLNIKYMIVEDL